ncbi:MAG: OmpA family protein [Micropepsaceae bacterium]
MSRWIVFAGITAMLVTGYFATFYDRGVGPLRAVKFIPGELQVKVEAALKSNDAGWAHVEIDGQKAILTGTAPSELDRDDVLEIARHAAGSGGTLWGGITKVDGESIKIAAAKHPYQWSAKLGENKQISLRGNVPSRRFKLQLVNEARKLFPLGVEDQTSVASGQPTGDWFGTALLGLQQLKKLEIGEVQFEEGRISIFGQSADDGIKEEIIKAMDGVKRPYEGRSDLSKPDLSTPATDDAENVEPAIVPSTVQRLPAADCQRLIDRAMQSNILHFAPGSTEITPGDKKIVETITQTALTCPELKLKVSGHTDDTPEEASATDLSRLRARAVSELLIKKGIVEDRLFIVGVGTTQPDPNSGPGNPGANRRVEFSVIP